MSSISAVVEGFPEVAPAEQAVARSWSGRGRDVAIVVSIGVTQVAWCAALGYAIWALVF